MFEWNSISWEWLDYRWFLKEVFFSFQFEYPNFLVGLPIIPILFILKWLFHIRFRQKLDVAFPKKRLIFSKMALLRFFPDVLIAAFIACVLIALARPQRSNERVEQFSEGVDIVIALDISESMLLQDFKPNRLESAKEVALQFIKGRTHDRIGLVVFSGEAFSLSPLTTDYQMLKEYIKDIQFEMITKPGTAIGSALGISINRLREINSKSKLIILISDGENTAGQMDPNTAANLAKAFRIKIYTIAVGKDGTIPYGKDPFGQPTFVESTINEGTLRKIATIGQGSFYRASSKNSLEKVFKQIDTLEKSEIKETRYKETKDFYQIYLSWGILCCLLWMFLKSTFVTSAIED